MVVQYNISNGEFVAGKPEPWATKPVVVPSGGFALHPDGTRLAMAPAATAATAALDRLTIVTQFVDELRRLAPSR